MRSSESSGSWLLKSPMERVTWRLPSMSEYFPVSDVSQSLADGKIEHKNKVKYLWFFGNKCLTCHPVIIFIFLSLPCIPSETQFYKLKNVSETAQNAAVHQNDTAATKTSNMMKATWQVKAPTSTWCKNAEKKQTKMLRKSWWGREPQLNSDERVWPEVEDRFSCSLLVDEHVLPVDHTEGVEHGAQCLDGYNRKTEDTVES